MNENSDALAWAASSARLGEMPQSVVGKGLQKVLPFRYAHLGSMASVGDWKGVIDTPNICKSSLIPYVEMTLIMTDRSGFTSSIFFNATIIIFVSSQKRITWRVCL